MAGKDSARSGGLFDVDAKQEAIAALEEKTLAPGFWDDREQAQALMAQLNRVAVAKTCRTAEKLLSLPGEQFARLKAVAEKADGRAVLRATEVLAKAETDMRFVSSPRVCLETAVMRIALPEEDMSTDALLVRLNALERKLQEGAFVASPAAQTASGVQTAAREAAKPAFAPPAETPVQAPKSTTAPAAAAAGAGAEVTFGKFVRTLRKTSRNGVLFTMCSDLMPVFEGGTLVLYTESGTVARSLARAEHRAVMAEVFAQVGVTDFDVRLKGADAPKAVNAAEQLKRDFPDYPIEIK